MARPAGRYRPRVTTAALRRSWQPLPWQVDPFHDRQSETLLLTGSAGGGKSACGCAKAHQVCMTYPGAFVLAVRKTRESMTSSTALFLRDQIIRDQARHVRTDSQFVYPNGSILKYTGLATEKERERIRSIGRTGGVDHILVDEANQLTEADYDELLARLRGRAVPWLQIVLATNPDSPSHWINRRLIEGRQASVFYSKAADNRFNPDGYERRLDALSGVRRLRLALGQWVSAEGMVHSNWDRAVNVVDRFQIPDDWPRIGSIDFGFENPTVAQWWALDGDRRMYLYRELYQTRLQTPDLVDQLQALSGDEDVRWVADPSAKGERAMLASAGVRTGAADNRVERGLRAVNNRLRRAEDGRPRMVLFADALVAVDSRLRTAHKPTCTADEFPAYTWARKTGTDEITDKPVKVNDHGMDAARYAAVAADALRTWVMV